jgi:hypothetical protein
MSGSRPIRTLAIGLRSRSPWKIQRALARGITMTVDSGGLYPLAAETVGRRAVAALFLEAVRECELVVLERVINGRPGLVFVQGQRVVAVMASRTSWWRVAEVWLVANPLKLIKWNSAVEEKPEYSSSQEDTWSGQRGAPIHD